MLGQNNPSHTKQFKYKAHHKLCYVVMRYTSPGHSNHNSTLQIQKDLALTDHKCLLQLSVCIIPWWSAGCVDGSPAWVYHIACLFVDGCAGCSDAPFACWTLKWALWGHGRLGGHSRLDRAGGRGGFRSGWENIKLLMDLLSTATVISSWRVSLQLMPHPILSFWMKYA